METIIFWVDRRREEVSGEIEFHEPETIAGSKTVLENEYCRWGPDGDVHLGQSIGTTEYPWA